MPAARDAQPADRVSIEPESAPVVQSVHQGFDWGSAAIGAGAAGAIVLLVSFGGVTYRHRHRGIGVTPSTARTPLAARAAASDPPGGRAGERQRTHIWSRRVNHCGWCWTFPTRLETKITARSFVSGTAAAR